MISELTSWIMTLMQNHGPYTVFLGVIIESVIVPIPSPLIIMGAGAILIPPGLSNAEAFLPILKMIIIPGALASTIGAYLMFGLTYWGGKPVVDKFHHLLGFTWENIMGMEKRIQGRVSLMIFLLRALPIVPLSLISAASGVLRIPFWQFTLWTFLGSIPRCLILGYLGYLTRDTYEGLAGHINKVESIVSGAIVVLALGLIIWLRSRFKES